MKKFSSITRVNSRRISQNKKLFRIFLVTVFSVSLLFFVPKFINGLVAIVVSPLNISKTWIYESGSSFPQYFRNRTELVNEISSLQSEIAAASGDTFTIKTLAKENEELRSLLNDKGEDRILAGVIGRPGSLPYDSLMLDRGTSDGVINGAPVFIGDSTVIGVVKNATSRTSLVELITTAGFEATVYIIGPDIYTNALGMGGGQLRVGVPQGILLEEGNLVVLPSVTSGVYGEISLVQSQPSNPEQYGYVSPNIPIASIRFVSIGKAPLLNISFEQAQEILNETKTTLFTVPVPEDILVDTGITGTTSTSSHNVNELYEE